MTFSPENPPTWVILHIPRSSHDVTPQERQSILLDDAELKTELLRMTDACIDELFPLTRRWRRAGLFFRSAD